MNAFRLFILSLLPLSVFACSGTKSYVVSISTSFTQDKNPIIPPPEKASFPFLVAVAHHKDFQLFIDKQRVGDETAEIARRKRTSSMKRLLERKKDEKLVRSYTILEDVDINDLTQIQLEVEDDASHISWMMPLDPSPDWFVGVANYSTCVDGKFKLEERNIKVNNYDAGLDDGQNFLADPSPLEEDERGSVGPVPALDSASPTSLAVMALEQGTLGVNWWKILLGVLVAVAVIIVVLVFIIPRIKKRKGRTEIPLTSQEGVEW